MDDMLMMEPPPLSIIFGMAYLLHRTMLLTLTAMTKSQSSSLTSSTEPRREMPTLLSSTSRRPHRSTAASTIRRQSSALMTLASNTSASPPSSRIMARVSSARACTLSTKRTLAPSRANRTAAALPLPTPGPLEPAPVTIATFPSSRPLRSGIYQLLLIWEKKLSTYGH